ncbi:mitochondrial amidoxime reducing component 2-like [Odontomachus brunneus]|uniref:mitochondrial amidoxime reducing component 2-like n=1 Tax=Odontomachus brunneus TaxID=486640 RepID=UPI0013F2A551|nr:mitochondrial amidoxime reducing component 2-like [Odontomachus brunneus]
MYKTDILDNRYKSLSKELADCTKKWVHVGTVKNVYVYPVLAGKAMDLPFCRFDLPGPSVVKNNCEIHNNMFIIYNRKTKRVYNVQNDPVMHTLEIIPVSKYTVLLTATEMHNVLVLDLVRIQRSSQIVPYFELYNLNSLIDLRCLDCGEEAAEWITKCLDKPDMRLGFNKPGSMMTELFWNQFGQLYTLNGHDRESIICYAELPKCSVISRTSYNTINEKMPHFIHMQKFLPNIVVAPVKSPSFSEIKWEWIKIGNTIIKHTKPWGRYINIEPKDLPIELVIDLMRLTCNVYLPGDTQIGNTVYIRAHDKEN